MYATLRILVLLLLVSCTSSATQGHEVQIPLAHGGAQSEGEQGRISLVFSSTASNVVVAIDGTLVVERVRAKRILITGVESGYATVSIAADGVERSTKVWVDIGKTTAVPIGNPGSQPERMNPLATMALSIVAFLISRAATDYLF